MPGIFSTVKIDKSLACNSICVSGSAIEIDDLVEPQTLVSSVSRSFASCSACKRCFSRFSYNKFYIVLSIKYICKKLYLQNNCCSNGQWMLKILEL